MAASDPRAPLPTLRIALRIANTFLLDVAKEHTRDRDFTDSLILTAVVQANIAPVVTDPKLQRTYAALDAPPPDEIRRPISINAIAGSLQLPFETVRRRVRALAEDGYFELTSKGVVLPTRRLASQAHARLLEDNYEAVKALYLRLRRAGALPPPRQSGESPGARPVRAVARLSSEYVLRMAEPLITHLGSLLNAFLLMALFELNTRHLPDEDRGDERPGPEGFVPDERRKPASIGAIAERLGIPYELARRRLHRLTAEGYCTTVRGGLLLPAATLARGPLMQTMAANYSALQRLGAGLADLGAAAEWEAELGLGRSA